MHYAAVNKTVGIRINIGIKIDEIKQNQDIEMEIYENVMKTYENIIKHTF